jgi:hypothetical protein
MSRYNDYALDKIQTLLDTRADQVGRLYEGDKTGKGQTDCITFVMQVLVYAYEKLGLKEVAQAVKNRAKKGTALAEYLVTKRTWKAHYWNPDTRHPGDNDNEHPYSYLLAVKHKRYYKIPLAGAIIDYNPTPLRKNQTQAKTIALAHFKLVPFAVGIARGGVAHLFVFVRAGVRGPLEGGRRYVVRDKRVRHLPLAVGSGGHSGDHSVHLGGPLTCWSEAASHAGRRAGCALAGARGSVK